MQSPSSQQPSSGPIVVHCGELPEHAYGAAHSVGYPSKVAHVIVCSCLLDNPPCGRRDGRVGFGALLVETIEGASLVDKGVALTSSGKKVDRTKARRASSDLDCKLMMA